MSSIESKDKRFAQNRVVTQSRVVISRCESEIVEVLSSDKTKEFSKQELLEHLRRKGVKHAVGTINNALSELVGDNRVLRRRSFRCAWYRINLEAYERREVTRMVGGNVVSEDGFVATVLELARAGSFEDVCHIHDVEMDSAFWDAGSFDRRVSFEPTVWVNEMCFRWRRNKWAKCWSIRLSVDFDYRVVFQVFDCGTLTCKVKCCKRPIPDRLDGLRALDRVVREACFLVFGKSYRLSFPDVDKWVVVFWHRGRDTKTSYDCRFNVLYRDFFNGFSRIYVREQDGRLRLEEFQNPNKTLGLLISEKEQLQLGWNALDEEKTAIPSMIASCVASCFSDRKGKSPFIDSDPIS